MNVDYALDDETLLAGFEACDLGEHPFGHREHIRVAWLMLRREPLLPAMRGFVDAIRRFAASQGVPEMYHETITIAFLLYAGPAGMTVDAATGLVEWMPAAATSAGTTVVPGPTNGCTRSWCSTPFWATTRVVSGPTSARSHGSAPAVW